MSIEKIISLPQQQEQAENEPKYRPDDDQLALQVAADWNGKVAYLWGEWRVYEGGCWQVRNIHEVKVFLRKFLRNYRSQGIQVTQRKINSLAQMLEDDLYIPDRKVIDCLEETRKYINLRNGLFNLETFELEDHRSDLFFTHQLDFDYDEEATPDAYLKYLYSSLVLRDSDKPDTKLIQLAEEALGYTLTARTDMKASFWLVGVGDSGKSTLIALLKAMLGKLYGTIDLTQLGGNRFMLSEIVGKRAVGFTENSSNSVLPDALYKALVGGTDEVYADVKNKPGITFVPEAKLWWAMNAKPRIVDRSGATFNRLHIIPFNRTIPENQRIKNLDSLLAREKPGIFNWWINGYKRLIRAGKFTTPEQSVAMRDKYRMDNDTEASFVEECCETHESFKVTSDALFQCYRQWCDKNGFNNKNRNQVSEDWERLGFRSKKANLIYWHGIRLRQDVL